MNVKAIWSPKVNMVIVLIIVTVCRPKVAYNVPGLEAVLRLGEVKDNDGAQQNKLFP